MDLAIQFAKKAKLSNVQPLPGGIEFYVFKASTEDGHEVVLRIPQVRNFQNANDINNDAKELIKQELEIYKLLESGPVPVPIAHGYYEIDDYPAMVSRFMPDDGTNVGDAELGRIAALIHSTVIPSNWDVKFVANEGADAIQSLVQRMTRRFRTLCGLRPGTEACVIDQETLISASNTLYRLPNCLLHLDLRDDNLRVVDGQVVAVIDWTNALIGPAAIDLYRTIELEKPGPEFLESYSRVAQAPELTEVEELFLRLDAALMLSLVFYSEAPDLELQKIWGNRVEELSLRLQAAMGGITG